MVGGGTNMCVACGASGDPCCAFALGAANRCTSGLSCQAGQCAPCGALGQACCGDGPVTSRICGTGLTCMGQVGGGAPPPTCR
jgi:hypothetical protein